MLPATVTYHVAHPREVLGSILGPNRVTAKDVEMCTYCCFVRCATLIEIEGEFLRQNAWSKLPVKCRAIKEWVTFL